MRARSPGGALVTRTWQFRSRLLTPRAMAYGCESQLVPIKTALPKEDGGGHVCWCCRLRLHGTRVWRGWPRVTTRDY